MSVRISWFISAPVFPSAYGVHSFAIWEDENLSGKLDRISDCFAVSEGLSFKSTSCLQIHFELLSDVIPSTTRESNFCHALCFSSSLTSLNGWVFQSKLLMRCSLLDITASTPQLSLVWRSTISLRGTSTFPNGRFVLFCIKLFFGLIYI